MKIITFGDTHGRTFWKEVFSSTAADVYVFIGDYFDTFSKITHEQQIQNLNAILQLKRIYPEKIVILMGNHEFHYLRPDEQYSGYQVFGAVDIKEAISVGIKERLIQQAYQSGKHLFTHAGLTKSWAASNKVKGSKALDKQINRVFQFNEEAFRFYAGDRSGCGDNIRQGPFWVRPEALEYDAYPGVVHVVGHTQFDTGIKIREQAIYTDAIGLRQYLLIEDGVPSVQTR